MMTKLSWLKEYGRTIVAQPGTLDFDEFRILVATKIVPAVVRVRVFVSKHLCAHACICCVRMYASNSRISAACRSVSHAATSSWLTPDSVVTVVWPLTHMTRRFEISAHLCLFQYHLGLGVSNHTSVRKISSSPPQRYPLFQTLLSSRARL